MKASILNRKLHRWGSILTALPLLVIILTGIVLLLKKDVAWIQPPTARSDDPALVLSFEEILEVIATDEAAAKTGISTWDDVDRLDVRPGKGVAKVRGDNRWEVQVDTHSGAVLQVAYRRSDFIESLHDGSWFHDSAKLWIFLPTGLILFGLWVTGLYLWFLPHLTRRRKAKAKQKSGSV